MRQRLKSLWATAAVLSGVIAWLGGAAFAQPQAPPKSATIDLQFVEETGQNYSLYGYGLDKDGKVELPFANAVRKLKLEFRDGKLRADTNGDGVIDEKDAPAVDPKQATIKVAAKVAGQDVQFPFFIQDVQKSDQMSFIIFSPRGVLQGTFGDQIIRFYTNLDGRYAITGTSMSIAKAGEDMRGARIPFSTVADFDGQLYRMEVLAQGKQLKLDAYEGPIASAMLQIDGAGLQVSGMLRAVDGSQIVQMSDKKPSKMIPGKYLIYNLTLMTQPENGKQPSFASASSPEGAAPIEIKAGQNTVKIGGPFKIDFVANRTGGNVELKNVTITGVAGEAYRPSVRPDSDQEIFAWFIRGGGKEQQLAKLQFG